MKKLFPLLLCILLLTACAKPYHGPTVEKSVPVLRTREWGAFDENFSDQTVYTYDSYGNLAQTLTCNNYQNVEKTVYTYDERGNLVKKVTWDMGNWFDLESYYPEFPNRTDRSEYTYDEQNRIILEVCEQYGSRVEYSYIYDDEARTRTDLTNGNVSWTFTYDELSSDGLTFPLNEYDDLGRPLRGGYGTESDPNWKAEWKYLDENGSYDYYYYGYLDSTHILDAQGNEIECIDYESRGEEIRSRTTTVYQTIRVRADQEE